MVYLVRILILVHGISGTIFYNNLSHENKSSSTGSYSAVYAESYIHCAALCELSVVCTSFSYNPELPSPRCKLFIDDSVAFDVVEPGNKHFQKTLQCRFTCSNNYTISMHHSTDCLLVKDPDSAASWIPHSESTNYMKIAFEILTYGEETIVTTANCGIQPIYTCMTFHIWSLGPANLTVTAGINNAIVYSRYIITDESVNWPLVYVPLQPADSPKIRFIGNKSGFSLGVIKVILHNCPCHCLGSSQH